MINKKRIFNNGIIFLTETRFTVGISFGDLVPEIEGRGLKCIILSQCNEIRRFSCGESVRPTIISLLSIEKPSTVISHLR